MIRENERRIEQDIAKHTVKRKNRDEQEIREFVLCSRKKDTEKSQRERQIRGWRKGVNLYRLSGKGKKKENRMQSRVCTVQWIK